jgi:beta-phosphoglucomutase-like phosphatase (HAD superfamily)
MIEARLKNIKAVVWDIDGVVYENKYLNMPNVPNIFETCAVEVARRLIPSLDLQEAFVIASQGYEKYGGSHLGFGDHARKAGLDPNIFLRNIHAEFHRETFKRLSTDHPAFLTYNQDLVAAFTLVSHLRHGVATHSCRDHWTEPLLRSIGIRPFFQDNAIFGRADVNFADKAIDPVSVSKSMQALGAQPQETAFFEDTPKNLKRAKEVIGGSLVTVFVHGGRPMDVLPPYIDLQVEKARDALLALQRD